MGKKGVNAINPSKTATTPQQLAALQKYAPLYYQYLMNPETFDYTKLPQSGTAYINAGGHGQNFEVDYGSLYNQLKYQADQKAAQDKATADAQAAADKAAADAAAKRQTDITTAESQAKQNALDTIAQWGLSGDTSSYVDKINQQLDNIAAGLGDTANPYDAFNGADVANSVLNGAQTQARNTYANEVANTLGTDYSNKLIGSNLLDSTINDILSKQQGSAQDFLDRGLARGIYNDTGYNAGENLLTQQSQAGQSQLNSLAGNVLDSYRTKADTVRDNAYNAANSYVLGQNFNLDDYTGQGSDILSSANKNAAGDLLTALGGQNFFDFSGLNNAAGAAQGATNLRDSNIASVLADRDKQKQAARGLGSQGVF